MAAQHSQNYVQPIIVFFNLSKNSIFKRDTERVVTANYLKSVPLFF